ncbi:MAG: hypothetical protein KJO55_01855 [Gammaproteobacteria bacterium]|nr:hypothetical protein [Gammaproteobacteria bacterium]NND61024.1 hypothetical protein [Gammaproteobacteria bacterium]
MLRTIFLMTSLAVTAMAWASESPAAADDIRQQTAANADSESDTASENEATEVSTVVAGNERFRYTMKLVRKHAPNQRMVCSQGRRTGSHKNRTYCRTEAMAKEEKEAAREFLLEAMRHKN